MRLFIAEKPSLGKAIASGLGRGVQGQGCISVGDDIVTWCFGHILEQAPPQHYDKRYETWRAEDLPIRVDNWKLLPVEKAKDQLKILEGLIKKASLIVNAGDPDREGQLLVDEVLHYFGWKGKTQRILLNAVDPASVKKALSKITDNSQFKNLYEAALCRQRADWLVGMNLTRAASKLLSDHLISIGRVQTPTLALVVRRDLDIEKFAVKLFYFLEATVKTAGGLVVLSHNPQDPRLEQKSVADTLATQVKGTTQTLAVTHKNAKEFAPLPFMLPTFQKAAEEVLGFSAAKSLEVLQALYEQQLVSYPRTDCPYLPAEQKDDALPLAGQLVALGVLPAKFLSLMAPKSRIYDSSKVAEHHGLAPTAKTPPDSLSAPLRKAWELVARQFLLSLLPDYEFEETEISFTHDGRRFSVKGETPLNLEKSWRAAAPKKKDKDDSATALPPVKDGEKAPIVDVLVKSGKTTPPKPYTEATLIADMRSVAKYVQDPRLKSILKETSGIGTAATQAATIETLKDRGFVESSGKKIVSTPFGRAVVAAIPPALTDPVVTAAWEDALSKIAEGAFASDDFMRRIDSFVAKHIDGMKTGATKITIGPPERKNHGRSAGQPARGQSAKPATAKRSVRGKR